MPESTLQNFARTALLEVTPASTLGDFAGSVEHGDDVTTYQFDTTMAGYPGWQWTITIAHLPGEEPTVVESELTPAEGALLAPDWVPWSDRMDEYRAAQAAAAEAGEVVEVDGDDVDDDDDDDDDDDEFGSDVLHGGDLDGVDIDEIDETTAEPEDLELLEVQVDEGEQAESETDSGSENPPRVARRSKRAGKEQQNDQGD